MNKVGIFVFSGTGNTLLTAEFLKKSFEKEGASADLFTIEEFTLKGTAPDLGKYDLIGIGYPVHALNAPRNVFEFIRSLPDGGGRKTFVFKSAGDPMLFGGMTSMIRGRLRKKGYEVFHETLFVMPSNVFAHFTDETIKHLSVIAEKTAMKSAAEILNDVTRLQRNSILNKVLSHGFSGLESFGAKRMGKRMKVTAACNNCGVCVKICPMGNIAPGEKKPVFLKNCVLCVRCINRCPKDAIIPWIKKFKLKKRYDIRKISADASIPADFFLKPRKGFFSRYQRYFEKQGVL